jgi:tRNA-dihydrouridine synthase C
VSTAAPERAAERPRPCLPFTGPWLLAPMEGVTEPCFRELVLARNPPAALGGAFTEFVRVSAVPLPARVLRAHLGSRRFQAPVGLQLMGSNLPALAESARRAVAAGAPLVDLNFGCPAKGALRGCAGSALLRDPAALAGVVRAVVEAVPGTPVTAKIRAGYDHAEDVEELARAAEGGGASLLTVHCRTRAEHYMPEVDWSRIARAVAAVQIPVCGNGGIERHADLARLCAETGSAFAMVGRGALADPWIFSGHRAALPEAARFFLDYAAAMIAQGFEPRRWLARLKQLLTHWRAGGLAGPLGSEERTRWLRIQTQDELLDRLRAASGAAHASC